MLVPGSSPGERRRQHLQPTLQEEERRGGGWGDMNGNEEPGGDNEVQPHRYLAPPPDVRREN